MVAILKRESARCRCRYCGRRRTLSRHPDDYIRMHHCGCRRERKVMAIAEHRGISKPQTWRVDRYRQDGREQRRKTCRCDGYSFPHYRGRGFCDYNPCVTVEDLQERHECGAWS